MTSVWGTESLFILARFLHQIHNAGVLCPWHKEVHILACVPQGVKRVLCHHIPFQSPTEAYIVGVTPLIPDTWGKRETFEIASAWNAMVWMFVSPQIYMFKS